MPIQATKQRLKGRMSLLFILSGAFLWSWVDQCMFGPAIFSLVDPQDGGSLVAVAAISMLLGLIFALLIVRRNKSIDASCSAANQDGKAIAPVVSLPIAAIFALLGAAGGALCLASFNTASNQDAFSLLGLVLTGFSMGTLLVTWGVPLVARGTGTTLLHLSFAWASGLVVHAVFLAAGVSWLWAIATTLPLAWLVSYLALLSLPANEKSTSSEEAPMASIRITAGFAILIVVVCGLFGFMTMSYESPASANAFVASGMDTVYARCLTSLAACIAFSLLPQSRFSLAFGAALSFLALGAITLTVALFVTNLQLPARLLVAVGYTGFDLLVWAVAARSAHRNLTASAWSITVVVGSQQVGIALGVLGSIIASKAGMSPEAMGIVLVSANYSLLIVAYFLVRRYADRIMEPSDKNEAGASSSDRESRIRAFAKQHGLTSRETDVLLLLSEGRNVPYIAEKFVLSENTVKSHVRHIYEKCSFHNRQELLDTMSKNNER